MASELIAAISTSLAPAGVGVIRISGDNPLSIANKMFKPSGKTQVGNFKPNVMYAGEIFAEGFTDYGMCVYFKAPKSFTGEDTVEFHCHGGTAITRGILQKILSLGVRQAGNGEFTKRAFINGKLSLASAEGHINMINSESVSGVKAGYALYRERLTATINDMQNQITDALSEIDADMDFPEEDLEQLSTEKTEKILKEVILQLDKLISTYRTGRVVKNGVKVAICGKPNTGKSSLLNAFLNYDKAIVSDLAGTTRDIVEGSLDIEGLRFNFYDTAGIRENAERIEAMGVTMSKKALDECDLVLFVLDAGDKNQEDQAIYSLVKDKNVIIVVNKTDVCDATDERADFYISAKTGAGIEQLKKAVYERAIGCVDLNGDFLMEERHYCALNKAKDRFMNALSALGGAPLDLVAIDIKDGWDALGEISGKTANEEIINNIFSKFCVGK